MQVWTVTRQEKQMVTDLDELGLLVKVVRAQLTT